MSFEQIRAVVADDFEAVNQFIKNNLHSEVPLIQEIGNHIVNSGGKRLRPLVAILSAKATGYSGNQHINCAAIIEFLHTSTLLHDDVVDESSLRRGRKTANALWGNAPSVLVGDFLISRAFQMVVEVGDMRLMQILADGSNIISEGEVLQLIHCRNPATSEADYLKVIHAKTAKMFESAAESGAILGAKDAADGEQLKKIFGSYAHHLGMAFQLVDDLLDYQGNASEMGKNVGDDLAEGKPTLPLIYTIDHGSPKQAAMISEIIKHGGLDNLDEVLKLVQNSGGLEYTKKMAEQRADLAIAELSVVVDSPHKDALIQLAHFSVNRSY